MVVHIADYVKHRSIATVLVSPESIVKLPKNYSTQVGVDAIILMIDFVV